jgi:hypothetical protein
MKTIEQAAIEFSTLTNGIVDVDRKLGFEAGVRFAQQWISVEDELPKLDENVFIKFDLFKRAEVDLDEHERILLTVGHRFMAGGEIRCAHSSSNFGSIKVTHWRPVYK